MSREITDYPNKTTRCIECDGEAQYFEAEWDDYTEHGYECLDCGERFAA